MNRLAPSVLCVLSLAALPAAAQDAPPKTLVRYLTGDPKDAAQKPQGPALILMGGGREVDAAFRWWRPYMAGGDVVVLRTSGGAGYNDYLFKTIGGCDSVETLVVDSRAFADDPRVAKSLAGAEAIFLAGGNQATYLRCWRGTAVSKGLATAWKRKAVIGGTSAGLAVLGEFIFSARNGTVRSPTALSDPHGPRVALAPRLIPIPLLNGVVTDSHFGKRKRLGRLVVFLARLIADKKSPAPLGIGVDERTALVVGPDGRGAVLGRGAVTVVRLTQPGACRPKQPLTGVELTVTKLRAGHTIVLPAGTHSLPTQRARVRAGVLETVTAAEKAPPPRRSSDEKE